MQTSPTTTIAPFTAPFPNHLCPLKISPLSFISLYLSLASRPNYRFVICTLLREAYKKIQGSRIDPPETFGGATRYY